VGIVALIIISIRVRIIHIAKLYPSLLSWVRRKTASAVALRLAFLGKG